MDSRVVSTIELDWAGVFSTWVELGDSSGSFEGICELDVTMVTRVDETRGVGDWVAVLLGVWLEISDDT